MLSRSMCVCERVEYSNNSTYYSLLATVNYVFCNIVSPAMLACLLCLFILSCMCRAVLHHAFEVSTLESR